MPASCRTAALPGSRGGCRSPRRRATALATPSTSSTATSAGQSRRQTHGGQSYFLLLVDDCSRYMWLHLLSRKDEAPAVIKEFQAQVETETGKNLRVLRRDRDS